MNVVRHTGVLRYLTMTHSVGKAGRAMTMAVISKVSDVLKVLNNKRLFNAV
jgi:hypothetical protein